MFQITVRSARRPANSTMFSELPRMAVTLAIVFLRYVTYVDRRETVFMFVFNIFDPIKTHQGRSRSLRSPARDVFKRDKLIS